MKYYVGGRATCIETLILPHFLVFVDWYYLEFGPLGSFGDWEPVLNPADFSDIHTRNGTEKSIESANWIQ